MPVPKPNPGEKQGAFVSRCMKFFSGEDTDMDRKQKLAVCYSTYRKSKKKPTKKAKAKKEETRNLVEELKKLEEYYNTHHHMGGR